MSRSYELVRFDELRPEVRLSVVREWKDTFLEIIDGYIKNKFIEDIKNFAKCMRECGLINGDLMVEVNLEESYTLNIFEIASKYNFDNDYKLEYKDRRIDDLYQRYRDLYRLSLFNDDSCLEKCHHNRAIFVKMLLREIEETVYNWLIRCHTDDTYLVEYLAGNIYAPLEPMSNIFKLNLDDTWYDWRFGILGESAIVPRYTTSNFQLCCFSELGVSEQTKAIKMRKSVVLKLVEYYFNNVWKEQVLSLNGLAYVIPEDTISLNLDEFGNIKYNFDFTKYKMKWMERSIESVECLLDGIDMEEIPFADFFDDAKYESDYLPFMMKKIVDRIVDDGARQLAQYTYNELELAYMIREEKILLMKKPDDIFTDTYTVRGREVTIPLHFDERGHVVYWRPLTVHKTS